jgi:hypothetical protein
MVIRREGSPGSKCDSNTELGWDAIVTSSPEPRIATGQEADLVVLRDDPSENIRALDLGALHDTRRRARLPRERLRLVTSRAETSKESISVSFHPRKHLTGFRWVVIEARSLELLDHLREVGRKERDGSFVLVGRSPEPGEIPVGQGAAHLPEELGAIAEKDVDDFIHEVLVPAHLFEHCVEIDGEGFGLGLARPRRRFFLSDRVELARERLC